MNENNICKVSLPLVTVGVCVRNCATTVGGAIKSIIAQDYPHECMEVLIVDGCSTDGTLSIIKKHIKGTDMKVRVFREDKGLGYARQIVVDNAHGKYIVWVDGDMILPKDFVRKQVEFMEKNPKVGIGRAMYGIWPELGPIAYLENIPFVVESFRSRKAVPLGICGTEGAIYRLDAIRQVGGFDINIKGAGEDTELAQRVLASGWAAQVTPAFFYELCKESWKGLWDQYAWWGRGGHYLFHKNRDVSMLLKMSPLGGLMAGILRFPLAYKLTRRKLLFLLPFHYTFKRLAFCYGFTKAHLEGYGH
ncbi:glycosyltransferase [Candidatus Bathyarchaeota archaeon]|nr:glycosyltransferase [Candidatus Bathyarchaeota archaeon]